MYSIIKAKKGFSLAEVIVSLGVAATAMVVAISMTSQSLRLAKENEIENTANEILVQSLELAKTPVPLNIVPAFEGTQGGVLVGSYKLLRTTEQGGSNAQGSATLEPTDTFTEEIDATSCQPGNPDYDTYKIEIEELNSIICNQIIFEQEPNQGNAYNITSIVVYEIGGEKVIDRVEAFRDGNFNIINR